MRQPFKPPENPAQNTGPMADKTTNRVDFVPHAPDKPAQHQPDQYVKPEGDFDHLTSHRKDYTKKSVEFTKPIKPQAERKVQGKFEGDPTYKVDYRKWPMQPNKRVTKDSTYRPNSAPFEGATNYKVNYVPHACAPRESLKPAEIS